ncbi:Phosphoribosyl 1,2-cyclic phosphodiesterase [Novipirellula aureliae]|uniref:Phosphoribosyl 1,2-cyclic phosphodiesterase n=1 Tax=Novipirellula aureliae TaxID=2527966 RepID=A0A5C6DP32_9BACT|nr:MBL fold metallo-hydrolase [Novipirellula aureliae]TWU37637.1 Phosphoribosyl 1,2-cyclic phosphodiesterase [Novipirellula aureliae]
MPIDVLPARRFEVVFLGTGTSVGVPVLGCECEVCQSADPHNSRTRCAILVHLEQGNLLIDTPPELRIQLLREKVKLVHSVLFTHEHADHLFGLDDLRLFPFRLGHPVPLYCTAKVEHRIRTSFDYAFTNRKETHAGSVPQLAFRPIDTEPFEVMGVRVVPIPMKHGPNFDVLGFRIGDFAYCTDTNEIPPASMKLLEGVRTFVVGALRFTPHPTHFNLEEAIAVARQVNAKQTYFTHLSHDLDYDAVMAKLPPGMALAYDGLHTNAGF